jgi:DNA polymerase-4
VRTILHVDMDAFFVSVELLDRPELRGKPVVVGGTGSRGVVAAASYEARVYGVFSAMPTLRARRLCRNAIFLPGNHERYAEVSSRVMAIFRSYTPLVEPISLDEAFLDVTGARRSIGDGPSIGRAIRQRVLDEERLACSVGVATSKFVAKLASEAAKPRVTPKGPVAGVGVMIVPPGDETTFLHRLPAKALWGVGPKTLARLERLGVHSIGDIAALPAGALVSALGKASGRHLHDLAHAVDDRPVVADQKPKSISHEETFPRDVRDPARLASEIVRMADGVATRLRRAGLTGRTVTLKVRFGDFRTITRASTLPDPVDDAASIARAARAMLSAIDISEGVRLLGVGTTGLATGGARQLTFDEIAGASGGRAGDGPAGRGSAAHGGGSDRSWSEASGAIDEIRERFGDTAIGPASAVGRHGLRVKRRGDDPWGPST